MGLIDYMSRNSVGLPIPPSEYDEEIVVAAIITFINNLEMIDILNQLANQNKAPCDLIKKRAEIKGLLDARTNAQLTTKHSKHSINSQLLTKTRIQSNSNSAQNQSTLHSGQNQSTLSHSKILQINETLINAIEFHTMRKKRTKNFAGGFIPAEIKTTKPRGRTVSVDWKNTSEREESFSEEATTNQGQTDEENQIITTIPPNRTSDRRKRFDHRIETYKNSKDHLWKQPNIDIYRNERVQFTNSYATNSSIKHSHTNNDKYRGGNREIVYSNTNK